MTIRGANDDVKIASKLRQNIVKILSKYCQTIVNDDNYCQKYCQISCQFGTFRSSEDI